MRGTSETSRDALLREFDPVATAAGPDAARLARDLFVVVDALDASGSLRRSLTDPARPPGDKRGLVAALFARADSRVRDIVSSAVTHRWGEAHDLGDALESLAVDAHLAVDESAGRLDSLEDELFFVERAIASERDLAVALDNRRASAEARVALVRSVFGGRVSPTAMALVERAARTPRGRRIARALTSYIAAAAHRRDRAVAQVTAAVELSAAQRKRLAATLARAHGREVQLNVSVDPGVVGGIRVQVGHQVVDGTILGKLDDARRRLVG